MNRRVFAPLVFLCIALILAVSLVYSFYTRDRQSDIETHPSVVTSIYPLEYIVGRLTHNIVEVSSIIPPGIEPHDFEPKPTDVVRMLRAPIVVANGAGIDRWVDALRSDIEKNNHTLIVFADDVPFLQRVDHGETHDGDGDSDHEEYDGTLDPHAWLDPVRLQNFAEVIARQLKVYYPNFISTIEENKNYLLSDLQSIDAAYASGLSSCAHRTVYVSHDAFQYIGKRYELTFVPLAGISPTEEPSAGRLAEITDQVKQDNATTIFYETLVSPSVAQTVAREAGLKTAVLNPIEGRTDEEREAGKDYLDLMIDNLNALEEALICA